MENHVVQLSDDFAQISSKLDSVLLCRGFETYPFLVGLYNETVQEAFKLKYHENTLAFVIVSVPSMYENGFKPFVEQAKATGVRDPIDECVAYYVSMVKQGFPEYDIDAMYDYELDSRRKPKILVQTAAHIAGAAHYYQRKDVKQDPWGTNRKIFGVCLHPRYGGWFAMRGVLIFKNLHCPTLPKRAPPEILKTDQEKIELLERFNGNWRDWTFRDVIPVAQKYSEEQKLYFETLPKDRFKMLGIERNLTEADCIPLSGHG